MAEKVIQIQRYKHPLPAWFPRLGFIALHAPKPLEFFAELTARLGVDEGHPVINFATALSRRYGLNIAELAALFAVIAACTSQNPETCYRAVTRLGVEEKQRDALLLCTTPERAAFTAEFGWQHDTVLGARCIAARGACLAWLAGVRPSHEGLVWKPASEFLQIVTVLIEAVRLEAGGQPIDHRDRRWRQAG